MEKMQLYGLFAARMRMEMHQLSRECGLKTCKLWIAHERRDLVEIASGLLSKTRHCPDDLHGDGLGIARLGCALRLLLD